MARVLEAEARISATDKTGDVFAKIGGKLKALAAQAKSASTDFDRHSASLTRADQALNRLSRSHAGAAAVIGARSGRIGAGVAALATGVVAHKLGEKAVHAAAQGAHERTRIAASGMTPDELKEAEDKASELSAKYRQFSQTSILHSLRNIRSVVGTFEEASHVIEPLLRLRTVAEGAHPEKAAQIAEDFDALIKGMEIKGVTQNLPKFEHYMDGMAKALNVFGDTLRAVDYYEMFKYGRQATQNLSDRFMLMTAPTLAQELGGSSAGQALATFYQTLVGGRMKDVAAKELDKFGLLDPSKIVRTKTGAVKGILPGGVKGAALAASDPYAWVNDVFLPALKEKGVTDPHEIQNEIAAIFRDRTAAQIVGIFATQQSRIQKDWALVEKAEGLTAAGRFMQTDPFMAYKGLIAQTENLLQAATAPGIQPATDALNSLAGALNSLSEAARKNPATTSEAEKLGGLWGGALLGMGYESLAGHFALLPSLGGATSLVGGAGMMFGWHALGDAKRKELTEQYYQMHPELRGKVGSWPALLGFGAAPAPSAYDYTLGYPSWAGFGFNGTETTSGFLPRKGSFGRGGGSPMWGSGDLIGGGEGGRAIRAELVGTAELNARITVEPSPDFLTRIDTRISNGINAVRVNGAPPVGTAGSTGTAMPETGAMP